MRILISKLQPKEFKLKLEITGNAADFFNSMIERGYKQLNRIMIANNDIITLENQTLLTKADKLYIIKSMTADEVCLLQTHKISEEIENEFIPASYLQNTKEIDTESKLGYVFKRYVNQSTGEHFATMSDKYEKLVAKRIDRFYKGFTSELFKTQR